MAHALPMRSSPQPTCVGRPEKPKPGRDGITTSNASSARPPVLRGIRERTNELDLLEHRPRPPVRDNQRHGIRVPRTHVDEVDVDAVNVRRELRQGIELCFGLAPVVVRAPITNEFLELRQLHALPLIRRGLLVRPARRLEAAAEVRQVSIGHADAERHHLGVVFSSGRRRFAGNRRKHGDSQARCRRG